MAAPVERHDGAAHRHAAEGDDEPEKEQRERDAAVAVGDHEIAQAAGIERKQAAEHQHGDAGAGKRIDGEQAHKRLLQ